VSDSLAVVILLAVALSFYLIGRIAQAADDLRTEVEQQRRRAELAEQRLVDVLAIPLPAGYGAALGAKPAPISTYDAEQKALLRANFDND